MEVQFYKLVYETFTVSPEVFVKEHLYSVVNVEDGYYLYVQEEHTFNVQCAIVIPHNLVDFNPVYKENWHKLIPVLESM